MTASASSSGKKQSDVSLHLFIFSAHPASPCKTLPYLGYRPICASVFPKNPASPVKRYPSEKHPEAAHNQGMFSLKSPYISDNFGHISDNSVHILVNRLHIQRKRSTFLTRNEEYTKKEAHPTTIPLTYLYVSRTAARWANKLVIMLYVFLSFSRSSFDNQAWINSIFCQLQPLSDTYLAS